MTKCCVLKPHRNPELKKENIPRLGDRQEGKRNTFINWPRSVWVARKRRPEVSPEGGRPRTERICNLNKSMAVRELKRTGKIGRAGREGRHRKWGKGEREGNAPSS